MEKYQPTKEIDTKKLKSPKGGSSASKLVPRELHDDEYRKLVRENIELRKEIEKIKDELERTKYINQTNVKYFKERKRKDDEYISFLENNAENSAIKAK